MEKRSPRDVSDWGPDLLSRMNHVHPESVDGVPADVVPVNPGDEDLALVVVHEESPDHCWQTPNDAWNNNRKLFSPTTLIQQK